MWDFSIGNALGLMARTAPFILLRMIVYFGITLAYILVTGTGAGIGYIVGFMGDGGFQANTSLWGGVIGFGLFGAVMYWAREYVLYIVKAGHIAVLVDLMDGRALPEGRSQINHATAIVKSRFAEASVLFAMDQLVKGVIRAISSIVRGLLTILPLPGAQQFSSLLHAFLRVALGFVDEVILAYAIRTKSENAWSSAKDALVLYGQNYKTMFKNAAFIAVIVYGLSFVIFLVMLAPAALIVWLMPGGWSAGGFVFALLLAWSVKAALLEPFAIACLMQVYFKAIEGQQPDPEWEAKLEKMSDGFRKLKGRALGGAAGQSMPDSPFPPETVRP